MNDLKNLKINNKRICGLLEDKINKLERQHSKDQVHINDLKSELDIVKVENEGVIAKLYQGMKDLTAFHHKHSSLLAEENQWVKKNNKEDLQQASVFINFTKTIGQELIKSIQKILNDVKTVSSFIAQQTTNLETIIKNLRAVDHSE